MNDELRPLSAAELAAGLVTARIGREIVVRTRTDSTNAEALRLAAKGAMEGTVVFAEDQTAGRGRLDRRWESPPFKNLYLSVILRPACSPERLPFLSIAAGVAVCEAVRESTGLLAAIKWPNDVLVGRKKVCGILAELAPDDGGPRAAIVGIGINVNAAPEDFSPEVRAIATSLAVEMGTALSRDRVAREVLERLDTWYGEFLAGRPDRIAARWGELSETIGRVVTVRPGGTEWRGRALRIDRDGALVLEMDGALRRVTIGDVSA